VLPHYIEMAYSDAPSNTLRNPNVGPRMKQPKKKEGWVTFVTFWG
jgi:hypothetical protein